MQHGQKKVYSIRYHKLDRLSYLTQLFRFLNLVYVYVCVWVWCCCRHTAQASSRVLASWSMPARLPVLVVANWTFQNTAHGIPFKRANKNTRSRRTNHCILSHRVYKMRKNRCGSSRKIWKSRSMLVTIHTNRQSRSIGPLQCKIKPWKHREWRENRFYALASNSFEANIISMHYSKILIMQACCMSVLLLFNNDCLLPHLHRYTYMSWKTLWYPEQGIRYNYWNFNVIAHLKDLKYIIVHEPANNGCSINISHGYTTFPTTKFQASLVSFHNKTIDTTAA